MERTLFRKSAFGVFLVVLLSHMPMNSAEAAAGNFEITIDSLNLVNTGESSTPIPTGTAWTGTINLFNTAGNLADTDQVSIIATVLAGPNGKNITQDCVFTEKSVADLNLSVISDTTGELGIDLAGPVAQIVATKLALFDFSCPTSVGGPYTMTISQGAALAKVGFGTGSFPIPVANDPDSGRVIVSGFAPIDSGGPIVFGGQYVGIQTTYRIYLPSQLSSESYLLQSIGIGGIRGIQVVNGFTKVESDSSISIITENNALPGYIWLDTFSESPGRQLIELRIRSKSTGLPTKLLTQQIDWISLSEDRTAMRIASITTATDPQGSTQAFSFTKRSDSSVYGVSSEASGIQSRIATIQVILVNTNGTPATEGHTVSAVVTGSALTKVDAIAGATDGTSKYSEYQLVGGSENVAWVHVSSDRTIGPAEINIYVTNVITKKRFLLGSRKVFVWGDVSKLEIVKSNYRIGLAGFTTGAATSTRTPTAEVASPTAVSTVAIQGNGSQTTTPAFIIKATDKLGQLMNLETPPEVVSSDTDVASSGACSQDDGTTTVSSGQGYGFYNCFFSIATNAKSGSKALLTIKSPDRSNKTGETTYIQATYEVTVGGYETLGEVNMRFDKDSYQPGQPVSLSITATDEFGNPVFDGHPAPEISLNLGALGKVPAGFFVGGVFTSDSASGDKLLLAPYNFSLVVGVATSASGKKLEARAKVDGPGFDSLISAKNSAKQATQASGAALAALDRARNSVKKATAVANGAKQSAEKISQSVEELNKKLGIDISGIQGQFNALVKRIKELTRRI